VTTHPSPHRSQAGFSLPELLISVTILLIISSAVTSALLQMTNSQRTIWNRTQLHAGVRSATELLQQEVGQAGLISLPGAGTTAAAVAIGAQTVGVRINGAVPLTMTGFFVGEQLVIDVGGPTPCVVVSPCQETVTVTAVNAAAKQITATFLYPHLVGAAIQALGGFGTGIVPPLASGYPNGSTPSILKLYGDINGDGNMVYVEYTCDPAPGGTGNLYRNVMPYDQAPPKVAATSSQVLLSNIRTNPGNVACFTYMPNPLPVVAGNSYVLDVAITLTVQTAVVDPITRQFQTETKALLNVSPRNVFNVWQLASASVTERIQPMPPTVTNLLPVP
jgi:prepilin-type N-terminal cleavage/methylation domain-containing protein